MASKYLILGIFTGGLLLAALSLAPPLLLALTAFLFLIPVIFIFHERMKFLVAAYVLCLPLSIAIPLGSASTATFKLYLSDALAFTIIAIFFMEALCTKSPILTRFWRTRYTLPILLWIGMGMLSMIPALNAAAAFGGSIRIARILLAYLCIMPYLDHHHGEKQFLIRCLLTGPFPSLANDCAICHGVILAPLTWYGTRFRWG